MSESIRINNLINKLYEGKYILRILKDDDPGIVKIKIEEPNKDVLNSVREKNIYEEGVEYGKKEAEFEQDALRRKRIEDIKRNKDRIQKRKGDILKRLYERERNKSQRLAERINETRKAILEDKRKIKPDLDRSPSPSDLKIISEPPQPPPSYNKSLRN